MVWFKILKIERAICYNVLVLRGNLRFADSKFEEFYMKIREIAYLLNAEVCCGEDNLDAEVNSACASDMMSDVLAFVKDQSVLISGLCNPQAVRTAVMMDMRCLVLVRGKVPTPEMIALSEQNGIVILSSGLRMFTACGILFEKGLAPGELNV
jgi:DRTGG domain.